MNSEDQSGEAGKGELGDEGQVEQNCANGGETDTRISE